MMNDDEIRNMFIRQRRNLMGMSVIVLFVTFSGLEFKKLNILGNELDVKSPLIVYYALWIAFAYWLIRYFQYLHVLSYENAYQIYQQKIFSIGSPEADVMFVGEIKEKYKNLNIESIPHGQQWAVMPSLWNPFFKRRYKAYCNVHVRREDGTGYAENYESVMNLNKGWFVDFRRWWNAINYTIWRTPAVSEYILPPLLAIVVVVACLIHYLLPKV